MKFKSATIVLRILLCITGTAQLVMMFMRLKLPTMLVTATIILLFIGSLSDFIETLKPRKLTYPIIIIYYFIGMPIVEKFTHDKILVIGFTVLGFILTMAFIYNDLIITNKEKNSLT